MISSRRPAIAVLSAFSFVLVVATVACSSPPEAGFTVSSEGGPVPHEVNFVPVESSDSATFLWEFGDGGTSDERSPTHIYQDAGAFTARLTVSGGGSVVSAEHSVVTEPGEAGWITVEPSALVLESGERQTLEVSAFDTLGNPVSDADFTWSADSTVGSVLEDGTFVAGPKTGKYASGLTIEYERLGVIASSVVPVEIVFGPLDSISLEPPSINVRVNGRVAVKVTARDRQGHVLVEPEVEWTPVRDGVDTVLAGGEFRSGRLPTQAEQALVNVSVTVDDITRTQTVSGSIGTGILDRVEVTPSIFNPAVGEPVSLTAQAFDRFGNILELDTIEWQVTSESFGQITADGVYTPSGNAVGVTGPLVTAEGELDRVRSLAEVTLNVLPGDAVGISLSPSLDFVPVGSSNPYVALVVDEFGNLIEDVEVTWSASAGGSITTTGVFVSGFETGEFPGAVRATVAAGASGNPGELTATADVIVRDRSSDMIAVEISNDTDARIMLIDLSTADRLPVSDELDTDAGLESSPAWWPDGSRLAYTSDISGKPQVYDIEIETGEIRQLIDDPDGSTMAAISPDGTRIAYIATIGDVWQLYVADVPQPDSEGAVIPVTREQATKLSADDEAQTLLPWWSPNGTEIAYTATRSITDIVINIAAADGSVPPRILTSGVSGFGWSDDGLFVLAIDNNDAVAQNLGVIESATGEFAGLIPLPFQVFLANWAPDSSELAVVDLVVGGLWLVDSDGSTLRQVVGSNLNPRRTAWRPVPLDAEAVLARLSEETP